MIGEEIEMIVNICLDDYNGMMFHQRRQSRDRILIEDVIEAVSEKLYIAPYSELLFKDTGAAYYCGEDFLDIVSEDGACFVENRDVTAYIDSITQINIYRWNRHYPSDFKFEIDLKEAKFEKIDTYDFRGSSHEKITKEIWKKKEEIEFKEF